MTVVPTEGSNFASYIMSFSEPINQVTTPLQHLQMITNSSTSVETPMRSDEVTFTRAGAGVSRAVDRVAPIASLLHLFTIHVALDGKKPSAEVDYAR
mmetsp:Transcript_14091/g.25533  ORF Transcript_14091/g.25533 Transcript_14091/m.25533 type:complete len:97 (+) Transcript_14091:553-843(+)